MNFKNLKIHIFVLILISLNCSTNNNQALITKAKTIHAKVLTIDTHCDTPLRMEDPAWDVGERHESGGRSKVDLPRMKDGGLDVEFFAAFVGQRDRSEENYKWAYNQADKLILSIKNIIFLFYITIRMIFFKWSQVGNNILFYHPNRKEFLQN